jgi:hypothetical protein
MFYSKNTIIMKKDYNFIEAKSMYGLIFPAVLKQVFSDFFERVDSMKTLFL